MFRQGFFLKRWLVVIVWMSVIFSASSDSASFQHSSRFLEPAIRWFFPSWPQPRLEAAVFFLRKCAHFSEFAILAFFVWRALYQAGPLQARSISSGNSQVEVNCSAWRWKTAFLAFGLVVAYAISDELHQHFVPSRQASVVDVCIDSFGAFAGLALIWAIHRVRGRF